MSKVWVVVLSIVILVIISLAAVRLLPTCDFIGGWGRGTSKACDCNGIKITVDNSLPVDGDYRTVCVGISSTK